METLLLLAGLILTLTEIFKRTFGIKSRYIPMLSLIIMALIMLGGWAYLGFPKIELDIILRNLSAVLTAMGIWSGVKATIGK